LNSRTKIVLALCLTISIFIGLVLGVGTFIGYENVGYAESNTVIGTNNVSLRGFQNNTVWPNIHSNVKTDFNSNITYPRIDPSAFVHPFAVVIGDCYIGKKVLVAPTAVCRGDAGVPIYVGDFSNIQDGVILHAVDTTKNGTNIDNKRFSQSGDSY
jgi:serine acetyltransferase